MAIFSVKGNEVLSQYKTEGYGKIHHVLLNENAPAKEGDVVNINWGDKVGEKAYRLETEVGSFYGQSIWSIQTEKQYKDKELAREKAKASAAPVANAPIPFNPGQPVVHQNGVNPQGMEQMFNMFQQFMAMQGMQMQAPAPVVQTYPTTATQMHSAGYFANNNGGPVQTTLPVQPPTVTAKGKGAPIVVTDNHRKQAKLELGLNRPGVVSQQDKLRIEARAQQLAGARF